MDRQDVFFPVVDCDHVLCHHTTVLVPYHLFWNRSRSLGCQLAKPSLRLPASFAVPCLLGWIKFCYSNRRGAPDGAVNVCSLLMYVTHISSHTLLRLRLDGAIKLFRLCLSLAGMMELNVSAAFGKTVRRNLMSLYQLSWAICPAGQSFTPTWTAIALTLCIRGRELTHARRSWVWFLAHTLCILHHVDKHIVWGSRI